MQSLLIKDVLLNDVREDIYILGTTIKSIGQDLNPLADKIIYGTGKAVIPSFVNAHTHNAMTLLRGFADDMRLHDWLEEKIWPIEAKLTEEDVYWGTRLATLEMIKSGTTYFNDMYWHYNGTAQAVMDSELRANLASAFLDLGNSETSKKQISEQIEIFKNRQKYFPNITFAVGVHALYTVSESGLFWARDFAKDHGLSVHMHLSETKREVDEWVEHTGKRPVEYLDSINFLGSNVIAAHTNWVTDEEIQILADYNVGIVHCPTSNMKLGSGVFPYARLKEAGLRIGLGTDGCAANNNLDMLDEMKIAALLQKSHTGDPTALSANEAFNMATKGSASLFGINMGEIKEGAQADLLLIDLNHVHLVPNHNLIPNLVYSAHSGCVDTTICNGKILMENRKIAGEEEVVENARRTTENLIKR